MNSERALILNVWFLKCNFLEKNIFKKNLKIKAACTTIALLTWITLKKKFFLLQTQIFDN
jgi:hypothetical protein